MTCDEMVPLSTVITCRLPHLKLVKTTEPENVKHFYYGYYILQNDLTFTRHPAKSSQISVAVF